MSRIVIVFLSFLFLIPQGLRAAAPGLSKVPLTSCASSTTTTFSTTDTAVYTFFYVTGLSVGDTFIVAFYGPSGQFYTGAGGRFDFQAAPSAGEACYATNQRPLLIAGNQAATMTGTWTVEVFYNNNFDTAFAAEQFTIMASGSTGGPTVAASTDPGSVTTNPFYYTNLASLTSSPMLSNFDARDIFGGTFTGAAGENGHAIFADTVPSTGYYSLQFQTKTPVQLTGYTLYLADDGTVHPASRSATHFTFLAGTSPGALSVISQRDLATLGSSYYQMLGVAPTNGMTPIKVTDTFAAAATYQYFEIRFTPNNGTYPGVRVDELVGTVPAGTGTCTYSLDKTSAPAGSGTSTASFQVFANPSTCAWTATSSAPSWLTTSSAGTGNGTVNYNVAANTSTSSRNGTITVGGQTTAGAQTFTVNQAGAAGTCSYSISPISNNMAAQGGSSSITVTVTGGGSCSWSASVSSNASSWLHLGSTTSGTASGSVTYTADANTSTVSRNGTIAFGSLTFTLTQAGGSSATAPSINQGGIVNAVSNQAGGGIAQGSMFSIYGSNLGPTVGWTAYQFPIPDHLDPGNVTVTVTQGSTTLRAYLLFVRADQINAIMPSNTPLGTVQVTVTYNGVIGAAAPVNIVKTSIGINSSAYGSGPGIIKNYISDANQPYNTASTPAKPGQVEIVVGTGLGPITTPDNQSPPGGAPSTPVQVVIGGIQANVTYSGRAPGNAGQDQINFVVPANATLGCSVPLQVSAGGTWSNTVRIAISADGSHCQDTFNPYSGLSTTGGKSGTLGLIRANFSGQLDPTSAPTSATLDLGFAAFAKTNPGTDFTYSPVTNLPPPGTCAASSKLLDLGAVMGDGGASLDPTVAAALDAGAQLTVTGGAGGATGTLAQSSAASPYMGLLGGILNVSGATLPPPFLDGGPFTISGPGGKDVGAFKVTVALSPAVTWTNPPSTINRASPLTLTWTGGDATETVVILGGSTDQTSKASGGFLCVAPAGTHSFTVPANSLSGLVPTGAVASSNGPVGILGLMPMHLGNTQSFTAPGLDVGIVFDTTMVAQTVQVQ